jgi:CRP-like cAMP-binding protein
MDKNELKYVLEDLHFSAALPPDVLDHLAEESSLVEYSGGTVLFREGTRDDNLYLVRSGRLALDMKVPGRGAVRIMTLGPGEMVGWSSLMDHGKMSASAVAVEDSEVVVARADKLRLLCEANCEFGFHLMRQMAAALSKRLVATRLQLLDLFADVPAPTSGGDVGGTQ